MITEFVSWKKKKKKNAHLHENSSAISNLVSFINMCGTQRAIRTEQEIEQAVFSRRAKRNYCTKLNKRGSRKGDA